MIDFKQVQSTAIKKVGYDDSNGKLFIQFKNHPLYAYEDVPKEVFEELYQSPTPGAYFQKHIRDQYTMQRIT